MSFKHLKQTRASFFMPEKMDFWFQLLDVTHVEHKFAPRLVDQSTDHIHVTYRPPSLSCLFCNLETAFAASRSFVAGTIPAALTLMSLTWEAFLRPTDSGVASASPYLVSWLRWRLAVATAASAPLLVAVWRMTCPCWRRPLGPWRVLIAQILQWTFRSFRPKQTPPSLCQMEEHHTRKAINSFSASFCVGTLCFTYVSFTFLSTILIPRSSFQFYANISVRQMWVVEWAHKQLVRFRSLCLHVSSHLLSDLMSMKLTSV